MSIRTVDIQQGGTESVASDEIEKQVGAFQDAVNTGDLETVVAAFEPEAIFVLEPDKRAHGIEEIRQMWAGIVAMKPKFELNLKSFYHVGNLGLATKTWSLKAKDPEGNAIQLEGHVVAVYRKQPDGRWLPLIDNACPFD